MARRILKAAKRRVLNGLFRPPSGRPKRRPFFGIPTAPELRALACPVCHVIFQEKDFVRHVCDAAVILRQAGVR